LRTSLDLNCDMGESFGVYLYGADHAGAPRGIPARDRSPDAGQRSGFLALSDRSSAAAEARGVVRSEVDVSDIPDLYGHCFAIRPSGHVGSLRLRRSSPRRLRIGRPFTVLFGKGHRLTHDARVPTLEAAGDICRSDKRLHLLR
jgi:hypothetical protein